MVFYQTSKTGDKKMKLSGTTKFILLALVTMSMSLSAGERPFRGELKIGTPNLLGFGAEYQLDMGLPGLTPYADFSAFTLDLDETVSMGISYFGLGAKVYLDEYIGMNGVFAGLGYGRLGFKFTDSGFYEYDWDQNWNMVEKNGEGSASFGLSLIQLKIGKRWMFGPITLSLETGYSIGKFDDTFDVEVKWDDGTKTTETESTSDIPIGGGTIGAFTIGFAF